MPAASHSEILAALIAAFPHARVEAPTFRVYLQHLADVPAADLEAAVASLIQTEQFFPTVRAVRERVAERALQLPGEQQALAQVADRMHWARGGERTGDGPDVHPLVREAVDLVGGFFAFRASENAGVTRGQFLRIYRDLRSAAVLELQTAPQLGAGAKRQALDP